MNRMQMNSFFAWVGTLAGLMSSALMVQKYPMSMFPEAARWSLIITLLLVAAVLTVIWPNPEKDTWWHRTSAGAALGGWVLLLSGYPLWGLGKYYAIGWSLTAYAVMAAIVYEYSQQLRKQQVNWSIITYSQIVYVTIATVAGIHVLLLLSRETFPVSTFCFLVVPTTCGIVSAVAARRLSHGQ